MGRSKTRILSLLLGGYVLCSYPVFAANASELRGRVTDKAGQPLPGAALALRNDGLAVGELGTVTDGTGTYRFPNLPSGRGYRLRVSLPTFASVEFAELDLTQDQAVTLDIVLRPASEVQETVRVTARPQVVNTESVTTSTSFTADFISGLPVLGRDYQDILSLAPGVSDVNGTGNPNIHGARDTGVVTLVDGVSTTDPFTGYYGQQLNIESIQEIEVITSGAAAEYSRAQGGFANILTKSGGNEFSGTFKLYLRSSRLDGDGAGIDSPELRGGLQSPAESRNMEFKDLYPFLSVSGPIHRDRLWYYLTTEYFLVETPENLLSEAFVSKTHGYRGFGKITWQMTPSQKLAFSTIADRTEDENQGITSLSTLDSGYTFKRGGPTYTLKETASFGPRLLLESSASWFDNNFSQTPTLNPDTNGNGIVNGDGLFWMGGNGDGLYQARETDSGGEFDRDGKWDIFEDLNHNDRLDPGEDLDGDGRLIRSLGCEGKEDLNCDGYISAETDRNLNGIVDPDEDVGLTCDNPMICHGYIVPGTKGNGKFDTEDKNGNGVLDTIGNSGPTPFPFWQDRNGNGRPDTGEFQAPLAADRLYVRDSDGRTQGPYPDQYDDHRKRFTLREDLSLFVADFGGTHDLRLGGVWEHEAIDRVMIQRPRTTFPVLNPQVSTGSGSQPGTQKLSQTLTAFLGYPSQTTNGAGTDNYGFFLQDNYKPLPNLTVGLGVRVDLENVRSSGYTPFDPAAERRKYNAILGLTGTDPDIYDLVTPQGLGSDPLYAATGGPVNPHVAQISSALASMAPWQLTRNAGSVQVLSPYVQSILPGTVSGIADLEAATLRVRSPEDFTFSNTNVAPRLSVSWDPFADGKTKGFTSWGRFYDKLFLEAITLELSPQDVSRTYVYDARGIGWLDSGPYQGYEVPDHGFGNVVAQSELSAFQVDRSLKTPYTDEWTAGIQREIAPEFAISLTYIHRNYRNQLQEIDVNHFTRIDPLTGRYADQLGQEYCTECRNPHFDPLIPPRPPSERVPDGLPDLYISNFLFNRVMRLGNYNTETYRAFELELVRRLSRKWQMEASYTYSKAWGDAESYQTGFGDDPTVTEYETGYMDFDQRHVVKLNAVAYLPRDWQIGGRAQWSSGLPYSVMELQGAADDVGYYQDRRRYGRTDRILGFLPESRNIHRNNAVYDFNVRAQKNFILGKATASGFLEIFNLLNSDDLRIYAVYPQFRSSVNGERRFGRRFQIGFHINF